MSGSWDRSRPPGIRIGVVTVHRAGLGRVGVDVRRGQNDELHLRYASDIGLGIEQHAVAHTLPPGFCKEDDSETVEKVKAWLASQAGLTVEGTERPPERD